LVGKWIEDFGGAEAVLRELGDDFAKASPTQEWQLGDDVALYRTCADEVSF
jgi:hypothetical protein